jgi:predicted GIY-YIG superfamily endonuclease
MPKYKSKIYIIKWNPCKCGCKCWILKQIRLIPYAQESVYILRDEKDIPFYVGYSISPAMRIQNHIRESEFFKYTRKIEIIKIKRKECGIEKEREIIRELMPLFNKKVY